MVQRIAQQVQEGGVHLLEELRGQLAPLRILDLQRGLLAQLPGGALHDAPVTAQQPRGRNLLQALQLLAHGRGGIGRHV